MTFWSQRMTDVAEADARLTALYGRPPTCRRLGEAVGLSGMRALQLRRKIERWNARPHQADDHVKRHKRLFRDALAALAKAAKKERWKNSPAATIAAARRKAREERDEKERIAYEERERQLYKQYVARLEREAAKDAEWRARRQGFIDQLKAQIASDPKLRELDQLMREKVRQQERKS